MRLRHLAFLATFSFLILLGGIFSGHVIATTGIKSHFPFSQVHDVSERTYGALRAVFLGVKKVDATRNEETRIYTSTFVSIGSERVSVPKADRSGYGGGLTEIGGNLVVQRHDGVLFLVDENRNVQQLEIEPPNNGYDDYFYEATEGRLKDLTHIFGFFRFNDILYIPDNDQSRLVISYTFYDKAQNCYGTRISQLLISNRATDIANVKAAASDWKVIFETKPCLTPKTEWRAIEGHMAGGRIAADSNGNVYLASGDYSLDGIYGPATLGEGRLPVAQDLASDYGKVLRIALDTGKSEIVSRGHRNMQGIAFDGEGALWVVEHGVRGGDELNLIQPGGNAGWPYVSYGTLYSALPMPGLRTQGYHTNYDRPKIAFLPSLAVSGLTLVQGFHETWEGDLLASTLRGGILVRFRIVDNDVVFAERINFGERVRYVQQLSVGEIALWLDSGEVVFFKPRQGGQAWQYVDYRLETDNLTPAQKVTLRTTISQCSECHSLTVGDNQNAPSLGEIYGATIGSTSYAGYSEALERDGRTWTEENLIAYLRDPDAFISGGIMPNPEVNEDVLEPLVSILRGLSESTEIPPSYR